MPETENRKRLSIAEKKLIDTIKRVRKEQNLSQEELSFLIKKNSNFMGMVESYRRGVSLKTLFKLARALKVEPRVFFE